MPVTINPEKCDACLKCADACPNHSIEKVATGGKEHAAVVRPEDCIDCFNCITECKNEAIAQG